MGRVAVLKENGLFSFPSRSSLLRRGPTETEWRWAYNALTSAPLPTSVGSWCGADRTLISWLSSRGWELVTGMKSTGTRQTFKARGCRWPWSEKVKTDRIWGLAFHSKTWRKGMLTTVFWKKKRCTASGRSLGLAQKSTSVRYYHFFSESLWLWIQTTFLHIGPSGTSSATYSIKGTNMLVS